MPTATKTAQPVSRLPAEPMKRVVDPADWIGAQLTAADDWQFNLITAEIAEICAAVAGIRARARYQGYHACGFSPTDPRH